jgi:hypothetical protein
VSDKPSPDSKLNFWMHYMDKTLLSFLKESKNKDLKRKVALVTHVDDSIKLARVKFLSDSGVQLIFMSPQHALEVQMKLGIERPFDFALLPSDYAFSPRKFKMGIVSRCYPDGRKNEKWLIEFAKKNIFSNTEIHFVGQGWESTSSKLRELGIETHLYDGKENEYPSYADIYKFYQTIDLYFYFGFDEGAMGSLDAYIFKCDYLISDQGFHSLFEADGDSLFTDIEDARIKLKQKIVTFERWSESINQWTWDSYSATLAKLISLHPETTDSSPDSLSKTSFKLLATNSAYRFILMHTLHRLFMVRIPIYIKKSFSRINN